MHAAWKNLRLEALATELGIYLPMKLVVAHVKGLDTRDAIEGIWRDRPIQIIVSMHGQRRQRQQVPQRFREGPRQVAGGEV